MTPQAWQLGSTGVTSGNLTGSSEETDETWAEISNSMMWDGTAISQEMGPESFVWPGEHASGNI